MDRGLFKLIVSRYWKILVLMAVVVIGMYVNNVSGSLAYWHNQENFLQTKEAREDFYDQTLDKGQNQYTYFDKETNKYLDTQEFEIYRQQELQFFYGNFSDQRPSSYGERSAYYYEESTDYVLITACLGFLLFFFDLKSHFNTLLFASKYSRKQIYWMKYLVVGGSLLLTFTLGKVYALLTFKQSIPSEFFNGEMTNLVGVMLASLCVIALVFIASSFAGLILGEWIPGILTIIGFYLSFPLFLNVISEFQEIFQYYGMGIRPVENLKIFDLNSLCINYFGSVKVPGWYFLVYGGVAIIFLISGQKLYTKLSLESNGQFLLFDQLKLPVLIVFMLYVTITIGLSGLSYHLYDSASTINGWAIFTRALISLVIAYVVGYFTIYRKVKIGKKTFFSFNKVA